MKIGMLLVFLGGAIITGAVDSIIGINPIHEAGLMLGILHKLMYVLWGASVPIMVLLSKMKGATRYWVLCRLNGINGSVKFEFATQKEALQRIVIDAEDPDFTDIVLVDLKRRVVEIKKGDNFGPLRCFLDLTLPGWDLGKV